MSVGAPSQMPTAMRFSAGGSRPHPGRRHVWPNLSQLEWLARKPRPYAEVKSPDVWIASGIQSLTIQMAKRTFRWPR